MRSSNRSQFSKDARGMANFKGFDFLEKKKKHSAGNPLKAVLFLDVPT